jgi:sodium-dependent dicarboxylate transporter 2/3/5
MKATKKEILGIILAAIIFILIVFLPNPEGLTTDAKNCIGIMAAVLVLWVTEALPIGVSGLVLIMMIPIYGIMSVGETFQAFISSVFFFVIATFAISVAIMNTPLAARVSKFCLKWAGGNSNKIILGFMVGAAMLSAIMSNVPVTALFMGLALSILEPLKAVPGKSRFGRALMIAIPFAAMIGGMATPAGSSINILALFFMEQSVGMTIPFVKWMIMGIPLCIAMVPISWWILVKLFKPEVLEIDFLDDLLQKIDLPERFTSAEKKTLVIIGSILALWIISSWVPAIDITLVALGGLVAFTLPGMNIFTWEQLNENISWEALLVVGGVTAFGAAATITGLGSWMVDSLLAGVGGFGEVGFTAVLGLVLNWIHVILPVGAVIVGIAVPPVSEVATVLTMNIPGLVFTCSAMASACYLLPIDIVPLITFTKGYYSFKDMFIAGTFVSTVLVILIALWLPFISGMIF